MRHAETVTFGGSGLNRAAELRGDLAKIEGFKKDAATQSIVLWRGKPLIRRGTRDALARHAITDVVFDGNRDRSVFLGIEKTGPVFAVDLIDWDPDDVDNDALKMFLDPTEQQHSSFPGTDVFAELRANMTRLSARDAELAATARSLLEWHRFHRFCPSCGSETQMAQAGWQRDCAACERSHFPRTDPVVIMLITDGNCVLMGRSPGWPEGMYSLLAGFVEPGETMEAAVRREVFEEAGVRVGEVGYLASQPWPFPSSLMMGCWGHATSSEITIDSKEIEDAIWVSREEIMSAFAGTHDKILPARKGAIAHFLLENWLADRLD